MNRKDEILLFAKQKKIILNLMRMNGNLQHQMLVNIYLLLDQLLVGI